MLNMLFGVLYHDCWRIILCYCKQTLVTIGEFSLMLSNDIAIYYTYWVIHEYAIHNCYIHVVITGYWYIDIEGVIREVKIYFGPVYHIYRRTFFVWLVTNILYPSCPLALQLQNNAFKIWNNTPPNEALDY